MKTNHTLTLKELQKERELTKRLITFKGFVLEYFNQLKSSKSNKGAYNKVSALYKSIFNIGKFNTYKEFRYELDKYRV